MTFYWEKENRFHPSMILLDPRVLISVLYVCEFITIYYMEIPVLRPLRRQCIVGQKLIFEVIAIVHYLITAWNFSLTWQQLKVAYFSS